MRKPGKAWPKALQIWKPHVGSTDVNVNVNVNNLLAISI